MVVSPVVAFLFVFVSSVSSGSRVLIPRTNAFLFIVSTPDFGLGFLIQAVMNGLGGCESGERAVLPRYVIARAVSAVPASGMSWNILRIVSLDIWSSITSGSSVRSKEMCEPRYLKWAVKSMKDPSSEMVILFVLGEFQYSSSLCFCVMV